ncbi:hypothetical protein RJ639_034469 [Escallonia herrerae]|uniref:Sec39 domain-containing protein n=1 Tax=Escallonia herrerae TaxID=1293975 RepID=A0AA88WUX9_9ASTE|nr:hypothetical protein RJ639_034469 [Escallonia herrerae]
MEESAHEVLYEIRHHASRPYASNYPPSHHELNEGAKGSFLSMLTPRGVRQLKEKWREYRHPQKVRKLASLFVSPRGEHVAVASGNQITMLKKDDDYCDPCGVFTSDGLVTFMCGTWSESHEVLGVADDTDTIYFIKANGEEITRIKKLLKASVPIIGLILLDDSDIKKSCLCTFSVLMADGSLHDIEISQDPSASISSACTSNNGSMLKKHFPPNVFCVDFSRETSLFAVVSSASSISLTSAGNTGSSILSIWQRSRDKDLTRLSSTEVDGLYSKPKGYVGRFTSPKVLFSPRGEFVATLDIRGFLVTFKVDEEQGSLSQFSCEERHNSSGQKRHMEDVTDFTWWSDQILTVAKRSGTVAMVGVPNGVKVSGDDPRSVPEMYGAFISGGKYQTALEFADRHKLDKDEVLKSQWLRSGQGANEIDMFLSPIKDQAFVVSECVNRVGPTEDAVRALLAYGLRVTNQYTFSESEDDQSSVIWDFRLTRLKLLQFRDRLETFLGINMGRFSVQEYNKFRVLLINEAAVALAESGKIGALNLLFKRHPYSLNPFMLEILAAIPETVPVQTYGQLLPGCSPPSSISLRDADWVECEKMVSFIKELPQNHERSIQIRTEPIVKQSIGFLWPSSDELLIWYKQRARDIDTLSGQLDNCLCLVDFACRKGICELQQLHEDISYLHQLIYSDVDAGEMNFSMSLSAWEQLTDYERFKLMLRGVSEENVVERLRAKAIPFMQKRLHVADPPSGDGLIDNPSTVNNTTVSFLVRWMTEIALENRLDICSTIVEEGCRDFDRNGFFNNEAEVVDCALQCIYSCSSTDRWSTMASMLSKLPQVQDTKFEGLKRSLKTAEGHIEAGRLLSFYQVPKPIRFFQAAHKDGKGVKQILRLILSKFIRKQPGRSDNDWANMWRDLQSLQEKAFPFLDLEYMLMEFCRGLLKAGKFSLARNYLKGTGSVALATDKAENLVIQAAREFFFSASSLACSEIWKAKECLNIFPSSRNIKAEADIIDALTDKLPNLGVHILPLQFRQNKDPMEIIKLAITSQAGAYLNVDEIIEIAKLFGLSSQDDISAVQEAIAREAAVAGDLQLACDLCLVLAKKGHGPIWDLCAALARGPALENMDVSSRKQLLGFALSHCDDESIGELLNAWKDLDIQGQCETIMVLTGTDPPNSVDGSPIISNPLHSTQDIVDLREWSGAIDRIGHDDQEVRLNTINNILSVANKFSAEAGSDWNFLRENRKLLSFADLWLPWLHELSREAETDKKFIAGSLLGKLCVNVRTRAVLIILSWLARNDFAPKDDLIAVVAKSIIKPPATEERDILGCSFLLNLLDAFHGVEIIEEQVRTREEYDDICSIMNVGMIYSSLHNSGVECKGPDQRRDLLLRKFQERHTSLSSDEWDKLDEAQSSFWREWKLKLEEQRRVADHTQVLEQIIPGVEVARFLKGDVRYMENVVFSLIESVKLENKRILKDLMKLASTYSLDQTKVLLQYLVSISVSEVWAIDDIKAEISEFKGKLLSCAEEAINIISFCVYPAIDGRQKQRLSFAYGLLSDCFFHLEQTKKLVDQDPRSGHLYEIIAQECSRVSFIKELNFKNISGLRGLNLECFNSEVYAHVDEVSVEALAKMVETLGSIYGYPPSAGLVSRQDVYRHHVLSFMTTLEARVNKETHFQSPENTYHLINELERSYDMCKKYIRVLPYPSASDMMTRFFTGILPVNDSFDSISCDSTWQDCLIVLLNFWLRLSDDMQELVSHEGWEEKISPKFLMASLKVFVRLVMEGKVSPSQGWGTVVGYANHRLSGNVAVETSSFCTAMIRSDCRFEAILDVYSEAVSQFPPGSTMNADPQICFDSIQDLPNLYLSILETILRDLASGSVVHENLHRLVSSLSKMEGDLEELKRVRQAVWARIAEFSDNLELPSQVRVYALELMQFVAAEGRNLKAFSPELQADVLPWEGWDSLQSTTANRDNFSDHGVSNVTDATTRFANTLVALKSSQLVSAISPEFEFTPDNLLTVESAVSCFLKVSAAAISERHCDALLAILGEWEGLFTTGRDEAKSAESSDAKDNWSNDDWDEGWESFPEEPVEEETKKENTLSVHPLHLCWLEILKKLVLASRFTDVLKLIDQSITKMSGILLDEDGACNLNETLIGVDSFVALKTSMLLPYEAMQIVCVEAVEDKLKLGGISDTIGRDHEFLTLVLYSGVISTIITKSSLGSTFSYLCYMVGNFCRQCQEAQLSILKHRGADGHESNEKGILFIFESVLFPCFISQLVKADQQILAGFLVTKFMHTNPSLSLINVAEASLRRYLLRQLQVSEHDDGFALENLSCCEPLVNTVSILKGGLGNRIKSALSLLPHTVDR